MPIDIEYSDILIGDFAENGSQLRPHIVWFGEDVPEYENAKQIISTCDVLIVVGTSLNVYPAAGLIHYAPPFAHKVIIDPSILQNTELNNYEIIKKDASEGVPYIVNKLIE